MTNDEWVTGNVTLTIGNTPLNMQMTVPAKPVKPMRMLPILQAMTSSFVGMSVQAEETLGRKISCQKGCGACCSQPVPLAEMEAYPIAELVENMPEPRRSEIKQKFEDACAHFREIGWFDRLEECPTASPETQEKVVMEYFHEGVSCPFLEDQSCSIHQDRPLACREYLVTSPAENCSRPTAVGIKMVNLLVKTSETLRHVGHSENLQKLGFVPMIRSLEWAEKYPEELPEKTGEQWMAEFFTILTRSQIPSKQN
jgi:Fe-S-cluster containining protein